MMRRPIGPAAVSLTAAAVALTVAMEAGLTPARAQQPPGAAAIVVLDGSNSMNGRLPNDRASKHVTVREALRATLPRIAPGNTVGLATFGARRASDCRDAEVVVPPTGDPAAVLGALDGFQPRGFSPVVLAMRTAAAALPATTGKASLVLVLDDLASCRGEDPCAVASDLKRQNPALAIHIVGLGLRPADAQVLACVARQTGGQLLNATDGPAVEPAIEQALALATTAPAERPVPQPEAAARPRPTGEVATPQRVTPATPVIDLTRPGVHISARLGPGAPTLLLPIAWRLWRAEPPAATETGGADAATQPHDVHPIDDISAPVLSRQLPAGRYEVEARVGLVTVRRRLEVTAPSAALPLTIDLDAGLLSITAPQARGAAPATDATLAVMAFGGASDTKDVSGTPVWVGRGGRHELVVPSGSYRVQATAGLATAERVVTIGPGLAAELDLALGAGRLVVEEQLTHTTVPAGTPQFTLEADDPDTTAGRRELLRTAGRRLEATLPAGTYVVSLRRGAAEVRERLQVRPGETLTRTLALPTARLRLVSRIGASLPKGMAVSYRVERIDVPMRPVQVWGEAEPLIDLAPGRYRVEARLGMQNAVAVRDFELRPGPGEARLELDTGAGGIQLRVAGSPGLGLGEVYWQIFDARGESIWRSGQPDPLLALGPGRYRARAELRDKTLERVFDVRAGDVRLVEVGE
jgi:hypothetical protein